MNNINININDYGRAKLNKLSNASYIDNFFYYLSSQLLNHHNCINMVDYYGSFIGAQDKFKYDITNDLTMFMESSTFTANCGIRFIIDNTNSKLFSNDNYINNSCKNKKTINIINSLR